MTSGRRQSGPVGETSLTMSDQALRPPGWEALVAGRHGDPFSVLGCHEIAESGCWVVRVLLPGARAVTVRSFRLDGPIALVEVGAPGLFAARVPAELADGGYRLVVQWSDGSQHNLVDPYTLPPRLGELDLHLLAEGEHQRTWQVMGAHPGRHAGHEGTGFAVWAPSAERVSVVGDFNGWDGRRHVMRLRPECGIWEIFLPGVRPGAVYKYEIRTRSGELLLKADPYARSAEMPPATASLVWLDGGYVWSDSAWLDRREQASSRERPISIYEVHAGSWQRHPDGSWLSYRELAERLVPWVLELGFTHIELLPISEHPFSGSWGYQPSGLFAPTARFGSPDDFRHLVDRCHQAGIGVLLDWVPGHFPDDAHGLVRFDGSCLYEHEDERQGRHRDWGTLIYNYGRREVRNFLISNALYWLKEYHLDGLRIDAVASMLYLDYSREPGDWIPNIHGDNRNLEAVEFLRRLNLAVHAECPGVLMIAEESTSWPQVSRPPEHGGLGFGYKWNMGWMNDTLRYLARDPVYRCHHHNDLTFGLLYAFSENFVLPISHDEVVHGKGSLAGKMPGDRWRQLAQVRLALAWQFCYPGKKLLFMGCELAQLSEWNHDTTLEWTLLERPEHQGVKCLVSDLNRCYREQPALHALDCEPEGFAWISCDDANQNVVAFMRRAADGRFVVVACNFSPTPRHGYRLGVPVAGCYREILNTDAREYGGSGVGNLGAVRTEPAGCHGQAQSLSLTVPPLAIVVLSEPEGHGRDA
ncbi:MAG: 1,4-alpha-glucan branching protein GlgB [Wenzhouxiangella sp.]